MSDSTDARVPPTIREGQPWVCPHTGIEFLWVPPGEFWMGSTLQRLPEDAPPELARRHDPEANRLTHPGALVPLGPLPAFASLWATLPRKRERVGRHLAV
jgi:hypothetical protein